MRSEDDKLVQHCLDGDANAFGVLVHKYQEMVYAYAFQMVRNEADAEDIAQEVFLRAYRHLSKLKAPHQFRTWLYTIMSNECRRWLARSARDRQRQVRLDDATETAAHVEPEHDQGTSDGRIDVEEALSRLSADNRIAVSMFYMSDCSLKEIGEFLGVSANTVKGKLYRARQQLSKALSERYGQHLKENKLKGGFLMQFMEKLQQIPHPDTSPTWQEQMARYIPHTAIVALCVLMGMLGLLHGSYREQEYPLTSLGTARPAIAAVEPVWLVYEDTPLKAPESMNVSENSNTPAPRLPNASLTGQQTAVQMTSTQLMTASEAQSETGLQSRAEDYKKTNLSGVVVDLHGFYIPSANVTLIKWDGESGTGTKIWSGMVNEYGEYRIPDLTVGDEYMISASAEGYREITTEKFAATKYMFVRVLEIMLPPPGEFFLEGTVRYTDGTPVAGAQVWADSIRSKTITDASGHYRLDNLPFLVEVNMGVDHPEHGSSIFGFIPTNQIHDFVITKAERYLAGKIVDTKGKPIAGAAINAEPPCDEISGHVNIQYSTNNRGEFRLKHVVHERESIYVGSSGIYRVFEDVETNRDDVEFVLDISPEMERRRHIEEKMAIMRNELLEPLEEMCGKPAPELDVAQWLYGKPVTLAKLKGKIVVLHFWPNGFHYNGIRGIEAIRLLNVLQKEYGKYGVVFIGIHESKSDADEQRKLMNEEEIALRIALDRKLPAAEARGATFGRYDDPAGSILVNRAGNIYGRLHYDKLEETIRELLSDKPQ